MYSTTTDGKELRQYDACARCNMGTDGEHQGNCPLAPTQLYAEFAQEDSELANEGLADYARSLIAEDSGRNLDVKKVRQMAIEMSIATGYKPVRYWTGIEFETVVATR